MSDSLTWSSTLLSSLYEHGVRHAVISPGSRSTPLTLAAAIHPGIQKRVVLDERSAAFIALGIGKSTGVPPVLICTSGTAVANYYPAVIEAKESGVPMMILSADRPPNLRNLGSSQTIDQLKIFGDQTVFFHEAGEPGTDETDLKRIAYAGKQAVEFSVAEGGAAHINLPFRKPLEPDADFLNKEKERLSEFIEKSDFKPYATSHDILLQSKISELISSSRRPLIIAGPANPHQALTDQINSLSDALQAPVLAEPGSGVYSDGYSISRFDHFLRKPEVREQLQPDFIFRFGDQPFSSSLLWALETWNEIPLIHFTGRKPTQDHAMSVTWKVLCRKQDRINLENIQSNTEKNWLDKWTEHDKKLEFELPEKLDGVSELTDGHVFHHFSKQTSAGWNVMLSNSLPARDMLTFGNTGPNQFVNRGAAGIDGILSTALGIHFASEKATCCFIGDLAFLHDSNALYTLQQVKDRPFVAIVINNSGGNIFRMLPVYRNQDKAAPKELYQTYFETPQKTDIASLARASGINHKKADSLSELKKIDLNDVNGSMIIECRTNPNAGMDLRTELLTS